MTPRPRPHVADLAPVVHGSVTDVELAGLGLTRDQVIDFSVNTNPLGPPPAAVTAARRARWTHYPDDAAAPLRRELAECEGRAEGEVVVGNGSAELIWLVTLAFLGPGDAAVVVGPTFGEYARATHVVGGVVHEERAAAANGFAVDLPAVVERVRAVAGRVVFLCNPNNPTGTLLPPTAVGELADAVPDSLVVVDEAYRQFVDEPPPSASLLGRSNVVLLRSLTKDYALPGLRLGYALAPASICAALDRVRPPWSVNAVAQAAGLAALREPAHLEEARAEVRRARTYLSAVLGALGLPVLPSAANYLLVKVGDARSVRAALLRRGVCVRDCTSFGLPEYVRVGLRTLPECEQLVAAFAVPEVREVARAVGG